MNAGILTIDLHGCTVYQAKIAYEYYAMMEDDETCKVDSVSEFTRIAQLSLQYLGYDVKREDGYFCRRSCSRLA